MNTYYICVVFITLAISLALAWLISAKPYSLRAGLPEISHKRVNIVLLSGIVIYSVVFSLLSIAKYSGYNLAMIDFGRMSQTLWNTLHGNPLACTVEFGNICRLIAHAELIFFIIVPFYALYQDPKFLLILQSLVISLGALPVFWIAQDALKSRIAALCFAMSYLLYPSLQYGNLRDFHSDMLAGTFLLFTFYFLLKRAWLQYSIFLLLSLMCKEYVALIAVILGLFIIYSRRGLRPGLLTVLIGAVWFFTTVKVIPGLLAPDWYWNRMPIYHSLGDSPAKIIKFCLLNPAIFMMKFFSIRNLSHVVLLLLPVGFLSLFSPKTLILLLPIYAGTAITDMPMLSYTNHHNGTMIPFIFISAIFGAAFIIRKANPFFNKKLSPQNLAIYALSCSLFSGIFYGPSPLSWGFWSKSSYRYWNNLHSFRVTEHDRIADKMMAMVPAGAAVSASNHLASHLSHRKTIYHFPHPKDFGQIDYIAVDLIEYFPTAAVSRQEEINALRGLFLNKEFGLKLLQDGILLFERGLKQEDRYDTNISVVKVASPAVTVNIAFDDRLLLEGYSLDYAQATGERKYGVTYYWKVLGGFNKRFDYRYFGSHESLSAEYILVDTIKRGPRELRVVHLPAYILYQPQEWKEGDIIREEFQFYIPGDMPAGDYIWKTGLYAVPNFFFIQTGAQHLVPETEEIDLGKIRIE